MTTQQDFTPTGLKVEGSYENDRNAESRDLFKAIIREAYGVEDVIVAHHLVYEKEDKWADGFARQIVEEIPSADALIFDHDVALKIWGPDFKEVLSRLALEPCPGRDQLLGKLYAARPLRPALLAEDKIAADGIEALTNSLLGAEMAHAEYEKNFLNGKRDENWAAWYANYILSASRKDGSSSSH